MVFDSTVVEFLSTHILLTFRVALIMQYSLNYPLGVGFATVLLEGVGVVSGVRATIARRRWWFIGDLEGGGGGGGTDLDKF